MDLDTILVLLIFVVTSVQTRSAGALDLDMQWLVLFSVGNFE